MTKRDIKSAARRLWGKTMSGRIARIERDSNGSRATYLGNNRVLVKVVVDNATIAYIVHADDLLITPWFVVNGAYENAPTRFFMRELQPDSHCLDIGANFGYFACLMARRSPRGRVIAVEADERIFTLTRDNIFINGFGEFAAAIHAAASDHAGEMTLNRRMTRSGNTSIVPTSVEFTDLFGEPPSEPFTVRSVTVDSLAEQLGGRVDFMKVDVEGAEPLVIAGARETIARNPQLAIVMEWSPGQIQSAGFDIGDFLGALEHRGLQPFDIERGINRLSWAELQNLPYRAGIVLRANQ